MTQAPQPETNNLAIASLVLGILSLLGMGPLTGIPALITGAMALKNPAGKGMAVAGLIMGGISTLFVLLIILIIVIFAIFSLAALSNGYPPTDYQDYEQAEPAPFQQRA